MYLYVYTFIEIKTLKKNNTNIYSPMMDNHRIGCQLTRSNGTYSLRQYSRMRFFQKATQSPFDQGFDRIVLYDFKIQFGKKQNTSLYDHMDIMY